MTGKKPAKNRQLMRDKTLELYRAGMSVEDITKVTGVSDRTVRHWVREAGLPSRYPAWTERRKQAGERVRRSWDPELEALEREAARYGEMSPIHRRLALARYMTLATQAQKTIGEALAVVDDVLAGKADPERLAVAQAAVTVAAQAMRALDGTYRTIRLALGQETDRLSVEVDRGEAVKVDLPEDEIVVVQAIPDDEGEEVSNG
jgi:DNA-binding transcriptional MerR regulator